MDNESGSDKPGVAAVILSRLRASMRSKPSTQIEDSRPELAVGTLVAGRYRIEAFVAAGANGQVYRAIDEELNQTIALKALSPSLASDEAAVTRLKTELLIARGITHPNVCRVFDVCRHHDQLLVSMEFLDGETLSARLERDGTLPQKKALAIVDPVLAGLEAVHEKKVVHGDIKGSNVMLCSDGRVVITDFGLARLVDNPSNSPALEGTPLYMAPEQISGEPTSSATDIYALGVLMYRMLSGHWPFLAATALSTALQRLHNAPHDPGRLRTRVDEALAETVLRCLKLSPQQRFADAAALRQHLAHQTATGPASTFNRFGWIAAIAVAALALGVAILWPAATVPPGQRIALLNLQIEPGDSNAWLGVALPRLLATQLRARGFEDAVHAGDIADLLQAGSEQAVALTLRQEADVRFIVSGKLSLVQPADGQVQVELVVKRDGERLSLTHPLVLAELTRSSAELADALITLLSLSPEADDSLQDGASGLPDAALATVTRGLILQEQYQPRAALVEFREALRHAPNQPRILLHIAHAQTSLGSTGAARKTLATAHANSSHLPRRQRLEIEARHRLADENPQRAQELYRALIEFFPNHSGYPRELASAQQAAGNYPAAMATLDRLLGRDLPAFDAAQVDLLATRFAALQGDFERARRSGQRLLEYARQHRFTAMEAEALRWQARTSYYGDNNIVAATSALATARQLYEQLGNQRGGADTATALADFARQDNDPARSRQLYQAAVELSDANGDQELTARIMNGQANLLSGRGQLADALAVYKQVLSRVVVLRDEHLVALLHHNIGVTAIKLGQLDQGWQSLTLSEQINNRINNVFGLMLVSYGMGSYWSARGDLPAARASFTQAQSHAQRVRSKTWGQHAQLALAGVTAREGNPQQAGEQAWAVRQHFAETGNAARARQAALAAASYYLAADNIDAAQNRLDQILALDEKSATDWRTQVLVANICLAQKKVDCALDNGQTARAQLDAIENRQHALLAAISVARVTSLASKGSEQSTAVNDINNALGLAHMLGLEYVRFEALLALAELAAVNQRWAEASELIQQLLPQAEQKGYGTIAKTARRMAEHFPD